MVISERSKFSGYFFQFKRFIRGFLLYHSLQTGFIPFFISASVIRMIYPPTHLSACFPDDSLSHLFSK